MLTIEGLNVGKGCGTNRPIERSQLEVAGFIPVASEKGTLVKSNSGIDVAALIGRIGPEAAIILRSRKAGPMADRRTRRTRTRSAQKRRAISDEDK